MVLVLANYWVLRIQLICRKQVERGLVVLGTIDIKHFKEFADHVMKALI